MSAALSGQQLADIRARDAAATKGPWKAMVIDADVATIWAGGDTARTAIRVGRVSSHEDAAFIAAVRTDVPALVAEVDRLTLTSGERLILRFALELVTDEMSANGADYTDADRAAMDKLRGLATGPTVAYRNPWRPGVLLCREHGEGWTGMKPLAPEDLPHGGTCTAGDPADPDDVCGRDVLASPAGGTS